MKTIISALLLLFFAETTISQEDTLQIINKQKGEPLEGMDSTWWNGGDSCSTPTDHFQGITQIIKLYGKESHNQ